MLFPSLVDRHKQHGFLELLNDRLRLTLIGLVYIASNTERREDYSKYRTQKDDYPGQSAQAAAAAAPQQPRVTEPIKAAPRVGRNDPCPCGSGKKYKNCHGKGL